MRTTGWCHDGVIHLLYTFYPIYVIYWIVEWCLVCSSVTVLLNYILTLFLLYIVRFYIQTYLYFSPHFKVESSRHWRDNVTQRCRIDQLYGVSTTEATRSPIWLRHVKAKHWFISLFIDSFCPYFTSWCCMSSLIGWPPPESFCRSAISDKQCSYRAHSNLIWKCLTVSDISWSAASFIFLFLKICLMY